MDLWREKAAEFLPEMLDEITSVESPMALWIELSLRLEDACDQNKPDNDLIARIYRFAFWCLEQPRTDSAQNDLSTAVAVAFIEDIPLNPKSSADLHRRLTLEEFDGLSLLFRYHLDEKQFAEFRREFIARKNSAT